MSRERRRAMVAFCMRVALLTGVYYDGYYMGKKEVCPERVLLDRFERYKGYLAKTEDARASAMLADLEGESSGERAA